MAKDIKQAPEIKESKFYGWQLLKLPKYSSVVARTIIKADKMYSIREADEAINNTLRKRG